MKYITPEMKISMFECESIATEPSTADPNLVTGLQDMNKDNVATVDLSQMKKVTKFIY